MIRRLERHSKHIIYRLSDGTPAVGASTIASINKPVGPLMGWAWKLGKEGKDFKKEMGQAADYGTIAHFMIECYLSKDEPDLTEFTDEEIKVAKIAYDKFLKYWETNALTLVAQELPLVSETHRFGGTLDLVALDTKDTLILKDWKTSKAIYESHIMQAVGYAKLWEDSNSESTPRRPIDRIAIVRIGRSPKDPFEIYWVPPLYVEKYWNSFLARLAVYNADKKLHT